MIVHNFIGNNGFEACIEKKKGLFRVGWRSDSSKNFRFIRAETKNSKNAGFYAGKRQIIREFTAFKTAIREFNQLVNTSTKVNFK